MKNYFTLRLGVLGTWGRKTVMDHSVVPGEVRHLHFVLDGTGPDEVIKSSPFHLATINLIQQWDAMGATGYHVDPNFECEVDEQVAEIGREFVMPDYQWLKVTGKPQQDDLWIDPADKDLIVSSRVLETILTTEFRHLKYYPYGTAPVDDPMADLRAFAEKMKAERDAKQR